MASTEIGFGEKWEHAKCRLSGFRNSYTVEPGLYAVGNPDAESNVFASANYKLSFDHLRSALSGMDAWVLVLDTRGVNVWCAAGKETFGTDELGRRISSSRLSEVVTHKRIIVPQLGAVGIAAHEVKRATGFRVHYGPVYAHDIRAYVEAGLKASPEMRRVKFSMLDRLVLTPMELLPAMKFLRLFALIVFVAFGLRPGGIMFREAFYDGGPVFVMGFLTLLSGAFLTPLLLPYIPFRAFSLKGYLMGLVVTFFGASWLLQGSGWTVLAAAWIWFPLASSYVAFQFTGSTTYTGMSGVEKELKFGMPLYIAGTASAALLLIVRIILLWGKA